MGTAEARVLVTRIQRDRRVADHAPAHARHDRCAAGTVER
jgi:hypothetical protein